MRRPHPATVLPATALATSLGLAAWIGAVRLGGDPVFQVGVAFTLVATFGLIWAFGARYADVGWMVVIATLLAVKAWVRPEVLAALPGDGSLLSGLLELTSMLAFAGFLLSFFRVAGAPGRLELAFAVTSAIYAAVLAVVPPELRDSLGLVQAVPRYLGAVLLAYAAVSGLGTLRILMPRRQRHVAVAAVAALAAGACYVVSARWITEMARPLATPLLDHAFTVTLGVLLVADLVVFHRDYVKARQGRTSKTDAELADAMRRELGRGARALLLGRAAPGDYEDFRYLWHHRGEGGTVWHDVWTLHGEQRILFGDVSAGGPLAPVAALAVLCLLSEAKTRAMTLPETAALLNQRLLGLFARQVQVSFAAVSLGADGSVEIFNAGEPGFFLASRDGVRELALNATPLGAVPDLEVAHEPVPLGDGDVLFCAGRSLLPDVQGVRRILGFFDEVLDFVPTAESVRDEVLRLAAAPARDDQILLVIERRAAAPAALKTPG
jgi:hypothetical protein